MDQCFTCYTSQVKKGHLAKYQTHCVIPCCTIVITPIHTKILINVGGYQGYEKYSYWLFLIFFFFCFFGEKDIGPNYIIVIHSLHSSKSRLDHHHLPMDYITTCLCVTKKYH